MKIAVVAANGKAGQLIVEEALNRGHDVTAVVRSSNKSKAQKVIEKDLFDLTKEDLALMWLWMLLGLGQKTNFIFTAIHKSI